MAAPKRRPGRAERPPRRAATSAPPSSAAMDVLVGELAPVLDEVKATVIALLASLVDKEKSLAEKSDAEPGAVRGLADVRALTRWARRTLRTIEVLNQGKSGELHALFDELGEFREILHARDGEVSREPS